MKKKMLYKAMFPLFLATPPRPTTNPQLQMLMPHVFIGLRLLVLLLPPPPLLLLPMIVIILH